MSDQQITCSECGGAFVFTEAEQDFYASKGLAAPPKRCKSCRQARRAAKEGGSGGGFGRAPARRFSNDVNEYRSPMGGGDARGPGGPNDRPHRSDRNGPPRAGFRSGPPGRGPARGAGGGGFGGGNSFGGGSSEYRSPSFPRSGGDAPRGDSRGGYRNDARGGDSRGFPRSDSRGGAGDARGGFRSDSRGNDARGPARGGDAFPRARDARPAREEWGSHTAPRPRGDQPAPADAAQAPRAPRQRPERPKYDITCGTCGAQAQVPFKPLEGRQVFCQACYRARKGTTTPEQAELAAPATPDTDAGIVE